MRRFFRLPTAAACATLLACSLEIPTQTIEPLPEGGIHVLFIGNSLTYTNNLPRTLSDLAAQMGDTIRVRDVSRANFAVIDHAAGLSDAVSVIQSQSWDYVVLQQGPTTTQLNRDTLIIATKILDPVVRQAGGRTANLMPWPRADEPHLFDAVRGSARLAAQSVSGVFIPAGEAWRAAIAADPSIQIYGGDGYHPAPLGTYLAALVMYEELTGRDARDLPDQARVAGIPNSAPPATVRLLQQIAHDAAVAF